MKHFLFFFFLFPFVIFANTDAVFSDDEDLAFCHHVNVISGNLNLHFQDTVIQGAQKFPIMRTYTSAGAQERDYDNHDLDLKQYQSRWMIQGGWSLLPHASLIVQRGENDEDCKVFASEKNGTTFTYVFSHKEGELLVLKPEIKGGQCSGILSARSNPQNNIIKLYPESQIAYATLYLPDGSSRYYHQARTNCLNQPLYHLTLKTEITPSRYKIEYKDRKGKGIDVFIQNLNQTKVYGTMRFRALKRGEKDHPFRYQVITSDGKELIYDSLNFKERNYLSGVTSNCRPQESSHFVPGRKGIGARMRSLILGNSLQFTAEYYKPPSEKLERNWASHPRRKDFLTDRVRSISGPAGPQGQMIPLATFFYSTNLTEVRDADYLLTRYHHDGERLNQIDYLDASDKLYSSLRFIWDGRNLKGKIYLKEEGAALFSRTFAYDDLGNVVEETLWGNLTGNSGESFGLQSDATLTGAESYRRKYTYLPNFNVPLTEEEEEGPTYRYSYLPDSNLITAKLVCENDRILMRHFFFYNEDRLLVREITDDGHTPDPENLTGVTERHIKYYDLDPDTGLARSVNEMYWDFTSGIEKRVKGVALAYNAQMLVGAETVYDAEGVYRYTLHTDYDSQGRIIRKTTPLGQENTYTYDALGNLLHSKEVGSPQKNYTYTSLGLPLSCEEIDAAGNRKISYSNYDSKGRLLAQTDTKGNTTKQEYDSFGKCLATEFPLVKNEQGDTYSPKITFSYDAQGNLATTTSPRGETTETIYNTLRKPIKVFHPDGSETTHRYNKNGTLAKTIYPDHTEVHYTYDLLQRMTRKEIYAESGDLLSEESWEYNAFHLLAHTDSNGLTTHYHYDSAGRLILEDAEGRKKFYQYDALGFLERTSDGNVTQIKIHDIAGHVIEEWTEDQVGNCENRMCFTYDTENRKIQAVRITSQGEAVDHFSYDGSGRLCLHTDPLGAKTQFLYDESVQNDLGQHVLQKTTTDPLGNQTIETYDALDHIVFCEKKNPSGQTVAKEAYFYDPAGNRSCRIATVYHENHPVKELCTRWEYDALGHVIKEMQADQKISLYTYDCKGRLQTRTLPSGIVFFSTYDGLDRLLTLHSSDDSIHYCYSYEQGSEPTSIHDRVRNITLHRQYNAFGELLQESNSYGLEYHWHYDHLGRCDRYTLPDNSSIAYTYSGAHLSSVSRLSPQGTTLYAHHYTAFDPNGHVSQEKCIGTLGTITSTHDLLERPSIQTSPWLQQSIAYGPSGLVSATTNSLCGNKEYAYDPLNQLSQENAHRYQFDSLGNPTDCEVDDGNKILASPACKLKYDPDGNPIQKLTVEEAMTYHYDAMGRLIGIALAQKRIRFTYDPLSRLLCKEIFCSDTSYQKILYLYDQEHEIGTLSPDKQILQLKVLGLGIQGDIGAAVALELQQKVYAPLHDFSGNIIALIDSSGNLAEKYQIDAFGKEEPSQSANPWHFCSKRTEEGFIFFGKRFYDPTLGRWLTPDPSGESDSPNLYVYVLNSPLNRLDLFGLSSARIFPWGQGDEVNIDISVIQLETTINSPNVKDVLQCKGAIDGIEVDYFVSCGHWHQLQFVPEELEAGKINIIHHFHDLVSKDGALINVVTAQNGINTSLLEFKEMCQSICSKIPEGVLFLGLHNPSEGIWSDLNRVSKEREGVDTPTVCRTRQFMIAVDDAVQNVNPHQHWMHISHSEGGLIAKLAIEGMDPDHQARFRQHLISLSIGPAAPLSEDMARKAINIYSKSDYVTKRFSKPFRNDENYDIRMVKSISSWSQKSLFFADHAMMGKTYQKGLDKGIREARKTFGIYDGKNR